ncbi:glycoside hydrolase family 99-like domain-containing protein [Paracoccus sp. (in: a-proteobacteria)]|uniref:glycoside hydrolase family 99-like domain-containing protein n=1 Tax=Paracoccus sp. TaxID=267 RepID=UPI002AFDCF71|nr:glycoside hydrolase family 99-like domain-containing protein [Paracoccus sp. (in: a-proteobacteria)]
MYEKAHAIAAPLAESGAAVLVIHSEEDGAEKTGPGTWINVEQTLFFGRKFQVLLNAVEAHSRLLLIQADASSTDWHSVFRRFASLCEEAPDIGLWSPTIDNSAFPNAIVTLGPAEGGLIPVVQTDAIVLGLHPAITGHLGRLDYEDNNLGWGIDWAAISFCRQEKLRVVRDLEIRIHHPKSRGYESLFATEQMTSFLSQLPASATEEIQDATRIIQKKDRARRGATHTLGRHETPVIDYEETEMTLPHDILDDISFLAVFPGRVVLAPKTSRTGFSVIQGTTEYHATSLTKNEQKPRLLPFDLSDVAEVVKEFSTGENWSCPGQSTLRYIIPEGSPSVDLTVIPPTEIPADAPSLTLFLGAAAHRADMDLLVEWRDAQDESWKEENWIKIDTSFSGSRQDADYQRIEIPVMETNRPRILSVRLFYWTNTGTGGEPGVALLTRPYLIPSRDINNHAVLNVFTSDAPFDADALIEINVKPSDNDIFLKSPNKSYKLAPAQDDGVQMGLENGELVVSASTYRTATLYINDWSTRRLWVGPEPEPLQLNAYLLSDPSTVIQVRDASGNVTLAEYVPPPKEKGQDMDQLLVDFHIDHFDAAGASGWAWYPADHDRSVLVEVLYAGKVVASTIASEFRPDLLSAGRGSGRYGFRLVFEHEYDSTKLRLRIGQAAELPVVALQLPPKLQVVERHSRGLPKVEGNVDRITRREASGWIWCPSLPDLPLVVEARLDDRVIGRALANKMRADLIPWGKGTGEYGFHLQFYETLFEDRIPTFHILEEKDTDLPADLTIPPLSKTEQLALKGGGDSTRLVEDHEFFTQPGPEFEDPDPSILEALNRTKLDETPLVFAYYLPQFHSLPVNDRYWGKGFTEWRQLARALPRFPGHYQPRIPRDLGFYDLNDESVLQRQVELAKGAGVEAFCYYYYWFNGERVMERPLDQLMASDIDMPFMIMWANENWTKTWDGLDQEVLLRQDYRDEDEDALLADLARHFADPRYVTLDGRPLFFLYNPRHLPNTAETIERWREKLRENHGVDPLMFMAQAFDTTDPRPFGLDGAIEFPPHKLATPHPGRLTPDAYSKTYSGRVIDYQDFVETSLGEMQPEYPLIKTVVPSWDNDARRSGRGTVLEGVSPKKYQAWLEGVIERACDAPIHGKPMVCINAWNEWAEAAYLEPDVHFGGAFLNATARALVSSIDSYVPFAEREPLPPVTVILPCYNHARFLPERIQSILSQRVPVSEIIFLDDCSTDDSVQVARDLLADSPIDYRIEVNEANSGNVFRQWLKGISLASNELIWIAETDDSVDPGFLSEILPAFLDDSVRGAYGRIRCIDPEGNLRTDLDTYYDGLKYQSWNTSSIISAAKSFEFDFSVRNIVPNASGFVFRKPVLSETEEERLLQYRFAGDWYFYALLLRGGRLAYRARAKSWFRVNPESASRSAFFTDRHLQEHKMVLADIASLYGLPDDALQEHAARLAAYLKGRDADELGAELRPDQQADSDGSGDRPLRICIAAHSFGVGGGEVVPLELANKMRRLGHHVTYLVMEETPPGQASIRSRLRMDIPVVQWDHVKGDIETFLKDYRIDILNSHNVGVDYHLYRLDVDLPCAWVSSLHGGYETVTDLLKPGFISYVSGKVDAWLSLAAKNEEILKRAGLVGADFRQSFNSVPDIPVAWIDRATFREEHGLGESDFALMICSRAIEEKGWRHALNVVRKINKVQDRTVHLFLIGEGPVRGPLEEEFGADDRVHFMGYVETPMRFNKCFDAAIFPSTYPGETFPLFLVECLEAGLSYHHDRHG